MIHWAKICARPAMLVASNNSVAILETHSVCDVVKFVNCVRLVDVREAA